MPLMIILFLGAILFLLSFIVKRRFGVLGLALCAGALLSQFFTVNAVGMIQSNGVILISPPLETVVSIGLVLLPALLLLFSGPKYSSRKVAFVSSVAFALFGLVLLMPALKSALVLDISAKYIIDFAIQNNTILVAIGVICAVLDAMLMHSPKFGKDKEKGHH